MAHESFTEASHFLAVIRSIYAGYAGYSVLQAAKIIAKNVSIISRYELRNLHFNLEATLPRVFGGPRDFWHILRTCLELERRELSDQNERKSGPTGGTC